MTIPKLILFLLISIFPRVPLALTGEQNLAKTTGIILYNQYKPAASYLTISANAGDSESQFYLAEEIRHTKRFITPEAQHWYEAAAAQGNLYALVRLSKISNDLCSTMQNCPESLHSSSEWRQIAVTKLKRLARNDNTDAMYALYILTPQASWLEKSAKLGNPKSQWLLANRYKEGNGIFILSSRTEKIAKLLKSSAIGGFPKGMLEYADICITEKRSDEARYWLEQAARTGFQPAVIAYGANLAHEPNSLGYPLNRVMGYAVISSLEELNGGGGSALYLSTLLPKIWNKMSETERKNVANAQSQWRSESAPLSFFPDPLGY